MYSRGQTSGKMKRNKARESILRIEEKDEIDERARKQKNIH